jgi:fructose-1,6-bisphosphatase/sedoheptulose 1,7-bisphosphatase-like protein
MFTPSPSRLGGHAAIAAFAVALVACSRVSDEQALRDFKAEFPDVTVEQQFVGEGNSDSAYMHFVYTTRVGERFERMWLYHRQKDSSWRAIHKSEAKSPGSDFGD